MYKRQHVRTEVSKKMHIRKAPRFIFVEDDGAAYAAHINELLRSLNVSGEACLLYTSPCPAAGCCGMTDWRMLKSMA